MRFVFLFFALCILQVDAQSISKLLGARAAGLGYATSTLSDEWSVFNNVAGLSKINSTIAGASYDLRPSLVGGNSFGSMFCSSLPFGTVGLGAFRFGDDVYNEQLASLSFANKIGNTSLGIRASYIQYRAENFGTHWIIGLDFGGITQITKQLSVGAWIQNINRPKLNYNNQERAPIKLFASLGFRPSEKFMMATEIEKDLQFPAIWKTGMEYTIHKKFFVRAGINLNPNALFTGVGFHTWRIKIDYSLQSFTAFNKTHQASLSYILSKIKETK